MKLKTIIVLAAAAVSASTLRGQQQTPAEPPPVTFRVEVNYVEVDAFVTDADGNVISDLSVDDFEVLEDGKPQKVTAFSRVEIPIERAERPLFAARPVEADVQTNADAEGRIYLIVLDDMHTDPTRAPRVKAAARRFIEQSFGTNDLAAVVYTGGRAAAGQEFTNNPRLLLAAIDKFTGRKFRSGTLEKLDGIRVGASGGLEPGADTYEMERAHRARSVMSTIRQLADFMAGVRGRRKAMLLIGEGVDYDIHQAMGPGGGTASTVLQDTHDAVAAASRGNVSIYAIDPRGLRTGAEDLIETSSTLADQGIGLQSVQNELRLSQDSLRVLAANTGGFAALNQNDFDAAFGRIVAENSSYYMLGYYSGNERRDGRYRRLEVRVKRPGVRVRARNGYYEPRGRRPAQPTPAPNAIVPAVAEALGSPLPIAGLPIKVFAAPYKGTAPNAEVALVFELDLSSIDFLEKDGTFTERLDVLHSATDANGKVFHGERHTVNLAMRPETLERVKTRGFRVLSQQALPPGRYQVRVAAGSATGQAGSVLYDLEVPDFHKTSFVMSGVAITSAAAGAVTTIAPKNPLGDFLPAPPTTAREFAVGDVLAIFAEFYENIRNAPPHVIEMKAELRADGGRVVRQVTEERSSTELRGGAGGYGLSAQLPTEGIEPGVYVLHVEGVSRAAADAPASRDILIRLK